MISTENAIKDPITNRLKRLRASYLALLALFAGALQPLALAPFNLWPLGLLGLGVFALLLFRVSRRRALIVSLGFGVGLYGVGASWVYVAIHQFGGASVGLAGLLTSLFVLFMAAIFALPFVFFWRLLGHGRVGLVLAFPACYLLGEWLRTWLFTGFPWLYVGYGHLHTPLAGWAPLVGVIGVGFAVTFSAAVAASWLFFSRPSASQIIATVMVVIFWGGGALLRHLHWTEINTDHPIKVAMVQPNIPQEKKWDPSFVQPTLKRLTTMSKPLWTSDWLIWPEAAIPLTYHRALPFLNKISRQATATHTGLISGIIYDDLTNGDYYNSVAGLGDALGIYHKRRLVPFGEYVPFARWLRGLIQFFDLPTSYINLGPKDQSGLQVGDTMIAPDICYEVAYPDLIARSARHTNVLLTISNDAWFSDSIGPHQDLQMAQMRALETGRYLVRSTNNGISALVNPQGERIAQTRQFVATTLRGTVYPAYGSTPFMRWGSRPMMVLALALLLGVGVMRRWFVSQ